MQQDRCSQILSTHKYFLTIKAERKFILNFLVWKPVRHLFLRSDSWVSTAEMKLIPRKIEAIQLCNALSSSTWFSLVPWLIVASLISWAVPLTYLGWKPERHLFLPTDSWASSPGDAHSSPIQNIADVFQLAFVMSPWLLIPQRPQPFLFLFSV